jgi:dTDP-4-amino-4,6-dideoxygalactose transaminase
MRKFKPETLENYLYVHDKIFAIPISPALTQKEMEYIIKTVNNLK